MSYILSTEYADVDIYMAGLNLAIFHEYESPSEKLTYFSTSHVRVYMNNGCSTNKGSIQKKKKDFSVTQSLRIPKTNSLLS